MVRTMIQTNFHGIDRISCKGSIRHGLLKTLLQRRDEFAGNHTAYDVILKFKSWLIFRAQFTGSDFKYDISKLTTTTSLFLVNLFVLNGLGKCFFVGNLRSALVDLYLEFTLQTIDDNFQVQFTHPAKNNLTCFMICIHAQGWIFFYQF